MYLSDIQRIRKIQRYLQRQKMFIEKHVRNVVRDYYAVDFNVYGYILDAAVLDRHFYMKLHNNDFFGLFEILERYPCECTRENLLSGTYFWLEKTYLGLDTKFWNAIATKRITHDYDFTTLEIAERYETLTYRAEEIIVFKG